MKSISIRKGAILALAHVLIAGFLSFGATNHAVAFDQPWNGGREDITRPEEDEEEECEGDECNCPNENNTSSPVYSARGYLVWKDTDIEFPTGTPISLSRTYNSFDFRAGLFGRGWVTAQEINIARTYKAITEGNSDGSSKPADSYQSVPIWLASYGRRYQLTETETGCDTPDILYFSFEKTPDGGFKQIFENSQSYVTYDSEGRVIKSYSEEQGVSVFFEYDAQGRLAKQFDSYASTLFFAYNDKGFVSTVTDQGNRQWNYTYDEDGRLIRVTNPDGNSRDYGYQVEDRTGYKLHLLASVSDNGIHPILDVNYSETKLYGKSSVRVKNYTDAKRMLHEYTYSQLTHLGKSAIKISKLTKFSNVVVDSYEIIADFENYRILSKKNLITNNASTIKYNDRGRVVETLDDRGNVMRTDYDDRNRKTKVTENVGSTEERSTEYFYDGDSNRIARVIQYGIRETTYSYDTWGRLTSTTETDLLSGKLRGWSYSYYENTTAPSGEPILGKMKSIDGPRGDADQVSFEYNEQGLVSRATYPLNHSISYGYNFVGQKTSVIDINGNLTEFEYDSSNRVTQVQQGQRTRTIQRNEKGMIAKIIEPDGAENNYVYDVDGVTLRGIEYGNGDKLRIQASYVGTEKRVKEEYLDSAGAVVFSRSFVESLRDGKLLRRTTSDQREIVKNSYDGYGALTETLAHGVYSGLAGVSTTKYFYDNEGKLVRQLDSENGETSMEYDTAGRLKSVSNPMQGVTSIDYSAWDEVVKYVSPDSGATEFEYGAIGLPEITTFSDGSSLSYSYDALNRISSAIYSDGTAVQYVYDEGQNSKGRLTGASMADNSVSYGYDEFGQLVESRSLIGSSEYAVSYDYTVSGRLKSIRLPSGRAVDYAYGQDSKLDSITVTSNGNQQTILNEIDWRNVLVKEMKLGGVIPVQMTYDDQGRLLRKEFGSSASISSVLDLQGNVTSSSIDLGTSQVTSFQYDSQSRIKRSQSHDFEYDLLGNRTKKRQISGEDEIIYSYAAGSGVLTSYAGRQIQSDQRGSVVNDGQRSYDYNAANQLISVVDDASQTVLQFQYNHLGQRVRKIGGIFDPEIVYVYGQSSELLGEYSASGTPLKEYIYQYEFGAPELVAVVDGSGNILFAYTDALGTVRALASGSGQIMWSWTDTEFGVAAPDEDPDGDGQITSIPHRFPGHYADPESGLYYNINRYYDPSLGRYLQSDPIGLDAGVNSFAYANSNPARFKDLLGLEISGYWLTGIQPSDPSLNITGWDFKSPTWNWWGYIEVVRIYWQAEGNISASVRCEETDDCGNKREWDTSNTYHLTYQSYLDVGPNVYATLVGLRFGIWGTIGANAAIILARTGVGVAQLYSKYGDAASNAYGALMDYGPDAICKYGWPNIKVTYSYY